MNHPILNLTQAISGGLVFLAAQAITLDADWMTVIERLGLAVALVAYFVWTGWQREQRMAKRIDQLEKQLNTTTSRLAALTELVTETIKRDTEVVSDAMKALHDRPCVAFDSAEEFDAWKRKHNKG